MYHLTQILNFVIIIYFRCSTFVVHRDLLSVLYEECSRANVHVSVHCQILCSVRCFAPDTVEVDVQ